MLGRGHSSLGQLAQAGCREFPCRHLRRRPSDLINVTEAATIQAGAGVVVIGAPGLYTLGERDTS